MATYTDNYTMTKPTYAEQADISVINANMDIIDNVMHSSQISLAPAYDINETYNTGDIVMHELLMYKCLEDNVTGAWDSTKWTRTTAGEESGGGADLDIYGEASGTAEASFSDGAEASLVECEIGIVPSQDLHGYSKPWAGGAGKNKLSDTTSGISSGVSYTDGEITFSPLTNTQLIMFPMIGDGATTYTFSFYAYSDVEGAVIRFDGQPDAGASGLAVDIDFTLTTERTRYSATGILPSTNTDLRFYRTAGSAHSTESNIYIDDLMIEVGSSPTTYEPYSNICPISGHTDVTVTVASTSGGSGEDTTVSLGRTVYGGTLDVTTGELAITHILKNITSTDISDNGSSGGLIELYVNGTTNKKNGQTNMYCNNLEVYASSRAYAIRGRAGSASVTFCLPLSDVPDFASAKTWVDNNPIQLVYELATPQTYTLTKEQIQTLLGQNYVSHDGGGTISLVYIKKDSTIIPNPSDAEVPLTGLEISGKDFVITDARIPAPPTTNGAYVLTVTVTGGTPTYSWENA